jgi:hypothetical protein
MNEMELLARLRADMPSGPVPARAANVLRDAIGGEKASTTAGPAPRPPAPRAERRHERAAGGRWGRTWRPLVAGAVTLAVVGAVALGQFLVSARSTPSPGQIGAAAAATARAQPSVQPGQWVLWTHTQVGCSAGNGVQRTWTTANAGTDAFLYHHKWQFTKGSSPGPGSSENLVGTSTCRQQPAVLVQPAQGGGMVTISGSSDAEVQAASQGPPQLSYASLGSLPRSPDALARYLGRLLLPPGTGLGRGGSRAFFLIYTVLSTYVLPPRLTAELYLALGAIPGLTVDPHATDVAGRPGIGLVLPMGPGSRLTQEIVLAPRTYHLLGYQVLREQRVQSGNAILLREFVHRP